MFKKFSYRCNTVRLSEECVAFKVISLNVASSSKMEGNSFEVNKYNLDVWMQFTMPSFNLHFGLPLIMKQQAHPRWRRPACWREKTHYCLKVLFCLKVSKCPSCPCVHVSNIRTGDIKCYWKYHSDHFSYSVHFNSKVPRNSTKYKLG